MLTRIRGARFEVHNPNNGENMKLESTSTLSVIDLIELAAANFIKSNSKTRLQLPAISLSAENAQDIQLLQDLLLCAEKVSNKDYDSATGLLRKCGKLSLNRANVMQRLVHCFGEALGEKIDRETGRFDGERVVDIRPVEAARNPSSGFVAFHGKMPFNQVARFTSIRLISDYVSGYKKVHIIDLEICSGLHYLILLQALAAKSEYRLVRFKITAVLSHSNGLNLIEETGVRLRSLAESYNLSFSLHLISLEDFLNLENNIFGSDVEESVIVHAAYALNHMIAKPNELESLIRAISNINPRAMIINELEANVNSPVFVDRFVEALFLYGAYFDCVEDCLKSDVAARAFVESELFGPPLRNSMAAEGDERKFRSLSIDVWRTFFRRSGMVEMEMSTLALDHAKHVIKRFECKDSCTLGFNGKCLIIYWKGTPICSISAWKFRTRNITT